MDSLVMLEYRLHLCADLVVLDPYIPPGRPKNRQLKDGRGQAELAPQFIH